ncbi:uncharacterized protein V1513DRAFT_446582 [Lipomyces chichibuensis]|uniref:uncharacterized protein n=1 Tax=Lipomyces chichibuensis TaxID=1546026 RepID=UPI003344179B
MAVLHRSTLNITSSMASTSSSYGSAPASSEQGVVSAYSRQCYLSIMKEANKVEARKSILGVIPHDSDVHLRCLVLHNKQSFKDYRDSGFLTMFHGAGIFYSIAQGFIHQPQSFYRSPYQRAYYYYNGLKAGTESRAIVHMIAPYIHSTQSIIQATCLWNPGVIVIHVLNLDCPTWHDDLEIVLSLRRKVVIVVDAANADSRRAMSASVKEYIMEAFPSFSTYDHDYFRGSVWINADSDCTPIFCKMTISNFKIDSTDRAKMSILHEFLDVYARGAKAYEQHYLHDSMFKDEHQSERRIMTPSRVQMDLDPEVTDDFHPSVSGNVCPKSKVRFHMVSAEYYSHQDRMPQYILDVVCIEGELRCGEKYTLGPTFEGKFYAFTVNEARNWFGDDTDVIKATADGRIVISFDVEPAVATNDMSVVRILNPGLRITDVSAMEPPVHSMRAVILLDIQRNASLSVKHWLSTTQEVKLYYGAGATAYALVDLYIPAERTVILRFPPPTSTGLARDVNYLWRGECVFITCLNLSSLGAPDENAVVGGTIFRTSED